MHQQDMEVGYDEYLHIVEDLCDRLKKSVVVNSSFAKIINIIKSNPEAVDRLDDMLERFNAVETVEEGNQLYETISNEIKDEHKNTMVSEMSRTDVLIPVLVDTFSYDEAFGTYQRVRCNDYTKNYEPMRLTPQQIKEFIDKGINLKFE